MPKMKTKSAAKKRFSMTGTGKIKGNVPFKRHCLSAKTQKMKRQARGTFVLDETNQPAVRKFFLPYGV